MTPKEQAAMQQALKALEELHYSSGTVVAARKYELATAALREALDHSGEANEMVVGWDRVKPEAIASDPLYQQGFVDGVEEGRNQVAEQAEQEPIMRKTTRDEKIVRPGVYEVPVEQPPQNPVGVYCGEVQGIGHRVRLDVDLPIGAKLYAAHVRTKELTDDEINEVLWRGGPFESVIDSIRAVIAADREKNSG